MVEEKVEKETTKQSIFSDDILSAAKADLSIEAILKLSIQKTSKDLRSLSTGEAMDDNGDLKATTQLSQSNVNPVQLYWYASQGFIGYALCAVIAQHWLVDKACTMPADDAIRKGYTITLNDGEEQSTDFIDSIRKTDAQYKITKN